MSNAKSGSTTPRHARAAAEKVVHGITSLLMNPASGRLLSSRVIGDLRRARGLLEDFLRQRSSEE